MGEMEKKYGVSLSKLQELKKFQIMYRKKRVKMVDIIGTVSVICKTDDEVHTIIKNSKLFIDENNIVAKGGGSNYIQLTIPFSEILAYNVNNLIINIQLKPSYIYEKCILQLETEEQNTQILNVLPRIERPPSDHEHSNSSESDFDDSGREKTSHIENLSSNDELSL